jgi:hypothetical protein
MSQTSHDFFAMAVRPTPLANARRLAAAIASTLRMARALATAGRSIDLSGLDGAVGLVCAKSLDLPPDEGGQMRDTLIALLQELDTLGDALQARTDSEAARP